jgi:tripartite-type tricarboxylate transporter receptor subunit TctC
VKVLSASLVACALAGAALAADDADLLRGKTVTMVIGYPAGGGTDAFGRLAATFLEKTLPGRPTVVVRNVPGADGLTAMNYLVQQAAADGLTITTAANTSADPLNYRKSQAHFDPTEFAVIGGAGRGGEVLLISKEAAKRLHDRTAPPVVVGSLGGVPHSGSQMVAWGIGFLGWNAKWVIGYRGTNELMLALERGEIDMTSTANLFLIQKLLDTGRFSVLVQSGALHDGSLAPRPEFGDAPILSQLMAGKLDDPLARQAFSYWSSMAVMDKWLALPPKSPQPMLAIYRAAYAKAMTDPEFLERGKTISDNFLPMSTAEVEGLIRDLAALPPAALDYMSAMLRKQGLDPR